MTTTPNLGLTHIEANQGQKEVTANTFADGLDNAIAGFISIDVAGDSDFTLDETQAPLALLEFTGVLTGNISVIIPTEEANKKFIIHNTTTGEYTLTVKHDGSDGFIVKQGERRWVYSDGAEIYPLIQYPRIKTVEFADPLVLDWSDAETIFVQLTDDTTVEHTSAVPGQRLNLVLQQDSTGARLIIWGSEVRFGTDIPSVTLTTDPDKQDKIGFIYNDDGAEFYDVISVVKGF
ncbi:MAG: hypothetical protein SFW66_07835 [Gammaproteobacteria bacterium]|nr:hypothetical protein [Gammaproteobacteria bacterium]